MDSTVGRHKISFASIPYVTFLKKSSLVDNKENKKV